jgi:lipoprotein-anchoring transpeptidase ErfK/SrfK
VPIDDVGPDAWATIAPAESIGPTAPRVAAARTQTRSPWLVLDPSFRLGEPPYRIARASTPSVPVFDRPDAGTPRLSLSEQTPLGDTRVFLVVGASGDRLEVLLPIRPNDSVGWVPTSSVTTDQVAAWVSVDLASHMLKAGNEGGEFLREPVATGTGGTPTPTGIYYVTDLLRPVGQPAYGPFAFALSAHSDVLYNFAGGDGTVGIHGTNAPGLLGSAVSHGCVRVSNAGITTLAHELPLGTPVVIA